LEKVYHVRLLSIFELEEKSSDCPGNCGEVIKRRELETFFLWIILPTQGVQLEFFNLGHGGTSKQKEIGQGGTQAVGQHGKHWWYDEWCSKVANINNIMSSKVVS
jgi:hypothetical protein